MWSKLCLLKHLYMHEWHHALNSAWQSKWNAPAVQMNCTWGSKVTGRVQAAWPECNLKRLNWSKCKGGEDKGVFYFTTQINLEKSASLTPAEWQRAAPVRRVSQNALNRSLSDELVSLIADKGERFTGQVEPLGQDLVAVVRETRVFTGNRILSWQKKKKETTGTCWVSQNKSELLRQSPADMFDRLWLKWHDSWIISSPSSRWLRADWYGALA